MLVMAKVQNVSFEAEPALGLKNQYQAGATMKHLGSPINFMGF
jgi:hypothetical protein